MIPGLMPSIFRRDTDTDPEIFARPFDLYCYFMKRPFADPANDTSPTQGDEANVEEGRADFSLDARISGVSPQQSNTGIQEMRLATILTCRSHFVREPRHAY